MNKIEQSFPGPGDVLMDRYRLERVLAAGGMGMVCSATQLSLDRPVAVKMILPQRFGDKTIHARFQREVDLAKQLRHPNIVEMYDVGRTDAGILYLVMELLEGRDLKAAIGLSGPMPLGRAGKIALQTLDALTVAHQADVVHRDLKPSNIYLTEVARHDDFVKLLDFGIARSLSPDPTGSELTKAGQVVGTSSYMAPEMFLTASVGLTADVYAMGLIILEMLIGQKIFQGAAPGENMLFHLRKGVEIPPGLSGTAIGEVLARATDRDPERRPQNAEELLVEVERALEHDPADLVLDGSEADHVVHKPGDDDSLDGEPPAALLPDTAEESSVSLTDISDVLFIESSTGVEWRATPTVLTPSGAEGDRTLKLPEQKMEPASESDDSLAGNPTTLFRSLNEEMGVDPNAPLSFEPPVEPSLAPSETSSPPSSPPSSSVASTAALPLASLDLPARTEGALRTTGGAGATHDELETPVRSSTYRMLASAVFVILVGGIMLVLVLVLNNPHQPDELGEQSPSDANVPSPMQGEGTPAEVDRASAVEDTPNDAPAVEPAARTADITADSESDAGAADENSQPVETQTLAEQDVPAGTETDEAAPPDGSKQPRTKNRKDLDDILSVGKFDQNE